MDAPMFFCSSPMFMKPSIGSRPTLSGYRRWEELGQLCISKVGFSSHVSTSPAFLINQCLLYNTPDAQHAALFDDEVDLSNMMRARDHATCRFVSDGIFPPPLARSGICSFVFDFYGGI